MSTTSTSNQIHDYIGPSADASIDKTVCYDHSLMEIEIRLNGETRHIPAPLNLRQLLDHFELPKDRIAIERNRAIVPKADWENVTLSAGDALEVVHFVGGGAPALEDPF